MKTNRESLENFLLRSFDTYLNDKDKLNKLYNYLQTKYEYPASRIADFLSTRASMAEASEFELFMLLDGKGKIDGRQTLGIYFTDAEIDGYSKAKYETKKSATFPLKFEMMQVADDQWIGVTSAKQLMELRDAQITSYNQNIQRTLQRVIKGNKEYWVIKINREAVRSIQHSMEEDQYIPNTITLNIPDDENSVFHYDSKTRTLIINSVDRLDLIDGYHRFVAITNATDINDEFDYPMELRITNYPEDKGQRFIYQEDQKTQMSRRDSESYNINDEAYKLVKKLNGDTMFNLQGTINRNQGVINFGSMGAIIKKLFFDKVDKKDARKVGLKIYKEIVRGMNVITENNTDYLDRYPWIDLVISLTSIRYFMNNKIDFSRLGNTVEYVVNNLDYDEAKIKREIITKPLINAIENTIKRVVDSV